MKQHLLLIDDDTELCELLTDYLSQEGLTVESVHDGQQGLERALSGEHDMVVLDVMLPEMGGFDVLRNIRETSWIPIVMLTARGDDVDRIVGLEMGADDYLPKPFNPRELMARLRAILRRMQTSSSTVVEPAPADTLVVDDITLEPSTHTVWQNEDPVRLTSAEFVLLDTFLRQAGHVLSRELLTQEVLERELTPYDRSIDVHVSNLRKKLGLHHDGMERIKTVRGVGYLYTLRGSTAEA